MGMSFPWMSLFVGELFVIRVQGLPSNPCSAAIEKCMRKEMAKLEFYRCITHILRHKKNCIKLYVQI